MKRIEYSFRDVQRILKKNGFVEKRKGKGNHIIFENDDCDKIVIPHHTNVNRMMFGRLAKEHNLDLTI